MIQSESELERKEKLDTIEHLIELLQSHRTTELISEKQYEEGMINLIPKIAELEKEVGEKAPHLSAKEVLYGEEAEKFKDRIDDFKRIIGIGNQPETEEIIFDDDFDRRVHKEIDDVLNSN